MSDLSGIISLYGFEYQKKVFLYYLISKMSVGVKVSYELYDDVEYETNQFGGTTFNSCLVQCKTGNLSYNTFRHVFCNWLLSINADKFVLYLDTDLSFTYTLEKLASDIIDDVTSYMSKEDKKIREDCFLYKISKKYNGFVNGDSLATFKSELKKVFDNFDKRVGTIQDLETQYREKYIAEYCATLDIDQAKEQRLELFLDLIEEELKQAICKKTAYSIDHVHFMEIHEEAVKCVDDNHYNIDYFFFKNSKKNIYESLLATREAVFLREKIKYPDKVIARYLVNELYYKDLRTHYIECNKTNKVDYLEDKANTNYMIESSKSGTLVETFQNTLKLSIDDKVLLNDEYREGCYIYLSSDEASSDYFIDWCGENARQ